MELISIEIESYKSIKTPVAISFFDGLPTVLIGKNGSGKTNVLKALSAVALANTNYHGDREKGQIAYHPTLDHIRPLSNGGCDVPENIVICHRDTNEEKADLFPHWMANGKRFHARRVRGSRVEYEIVED